MGAITPRMRAEYGAYSYVADWIPRKVLERIDDTEAHDRLDEARDLIRKADSASGELVWGYRERARAVCEAAPRDDVEREAAAWITKADAAHTPVHAANCRGIAQRLRDMNPAAPRRSRSSARATAFVTSEVAALIKAEVTRGSAAFLAKGATRLDRLGEEISALQGRLDVLVKVQRPDLVKATR
jgi:hypothetical protein